MRPQGVSGYPANQARGLPYITGLLILNDDDTGLPLAVMDCTWITGMRTGRPDPLRKRAARSTSNSRAVCGVKSSIRQIFAVVPPIS